jgi:CRISPR-associated endonuclease/helicase Cas3
MAGGTTPPSGATRYLETKQGILSYLQLAPLLAERVLRVELKIESADFSTAALDEEFLRNLHFMIAGDLVDWAGSWRAIQVQVSQHQPPLPPRIPELLRNYFDDLNARFANLAPGDDLLLETLAFAEGRLLSIHPFQDFNGRVTRLFLREILRRLEIPPVPLAPRDDDEKRSYLTALAAGDLSDWTPLMFVWRTRLS